MIGELVGHYRVVGSLGSGGMGVVWKAIDTRLNRPVALKAIRDSDATSTDAILRLRAEALAAASLDHPYICKIYELLETGTATLVVMEFVEGETLGDILARRTPALVDTLRYGSEIAEGLANAHARGIVHRDVKPTNVMVTPHNHVKLLDFGIARITADVALTESGLTLPGNTPGTPQYMAPEQALGRHVDGRADLFALGALLFRCLAGQLPFEGATRDEYVQQMLAGRVRSLEQLAPAAPEPVRAIVLACLERDPARRPESATVVAETLRRSADALSTGTLPVARRPSPALPRWAIQVALLGLAAAALAFGVSRWSTGSAEDPRPRALIPAVTWPSAESDALISPDSKWLSFISDKPGEPRIFVQAIEGGDAVAVAVPGVAVSHGWSPDGREIAAIVRQNGGHFLVVVPAFFGGAPRLSIPIDSKLEDLILLRWVANDVYIDASLGQAGRSLRRARLDAVTLEDVNGRWPKPLRYRNIDVAPQTAAVVMAALIDGRPDLYTSSIDGSNLQPLTADAYVERDPLWVSRDLVAFESNRGGQMDLWEMSTSTRRSTQLTSSLMTEVPTGAAASGAIAFEQLANTVNLWLLPLAGGEARRLTGDALSDYWPAANGGRIAFQRARPTPEEGFQFIDARIMVARQEGTAPLEPQGVADGFGPRLSRDGNWVAYYQRITDRGRLRLLVRNLATGEVRTLSESCVLPGLTPNPPVDWIEQTLTWGSGLDLYFLVEGNERQEIHRADLASPPPPSLLVPVAAGDHVRDLRISSDGKTLAYLVRVRKTAEASRDEDRVVELHLYDLAARRDAVIAREPGPVREVYLPGWTERDQPLLMRAKGPVAGLYELQLTEVSVDGRKRQAATISDSFASTVRVDATRGLLLLTRSDRGIHNVYALTLADGKMRRLTSNEAPGVSFSGIEPLRDGILIARDERRRDIWLVQPR